MGTTQRCRGYGTIAAHDADPSAFSAGKTRCKACTAAYFADWRAAKTAGRPTRTYNRKPAAVAAPQAAPAPQEVAIPAAQVEIAPQAAQAVPDPITANGHTYRPDPELVNLFDAAVAATRRGHPVTIALHGPSGSGKTDGARYLASRIGRPFVKIDCKSMIDAESFFGTRGATNGSTYYQPSVFVNAIQSPSVVLLDEYTRVSNDVRDVLNPILDGTRAVLNPITGEVVQLHPDCIVMLAGNVGFRFTGTYDVDPALTSRVAVHVVDYTDPETERAILMESAGIAEETARRFVALAVESRANTRLPSISTRELLTMAHLVASGASETAAVRAAVIFGASDEGGAQSPRAMLDTLWSGIGAKTAEDGSAQTDGTVPA